MPLRQSSRVPRQRDGFVARTYTTWCTGVRNWCMKAMVQDREDTSRAAADFASLLKISLVKAQAGGANDLALRVLTMIVQVKIRRRF